MYLFHINWANLNKRNKCLTDPTPSSNSVSFQNNLHTPTLQRAVFCSVSKVQGKLEGHIPRCAFPGCASCKLFMYQLKGKHRFGCCSVVYSDNIHYASLLRQFQLTVLQTWDNIKPVSNHISCYEVDWFGARSPTCLLLAHLKWLDCGAACRVSIFWLSIRMHSA